MSHLETMGERHYGVATGRDPTQVLLGRQSLFWLPPCLCWCAQPLGDPAVEVAAAKVAAKLGQQGACVGRLSDPSGIRGNSTVRPLFFCYDRVKTMGTKDKLETVT